MLDAVAVTPFPPATHNIMQARSLYTYGDAVTHLGRHSCSHRAAAQALDRYCRFYSGATLAITASITRWDRSPDDTVKDLGEPL